MIDCPASIKNNVQMREVQTMEMSNFVSQSISINLEQAAFPAKQ